MAKAKKRAKKPAKRPPTPVIQTAPGRRFATLRNITLPILTCKIEKSINVTFLENVRNLDHREVGAEALARVTDLDAGDTKDLAMPDGLCNIFGQTYDDGKLEGKSFCITRHAKHERKNEFGFSVEEIDPAQRIEAPAGDGANGSA